MKIIPVSLPNKKVSVPCYVDDDFYALHGHRRWRCKPDKRNFYADTKINGKKITMHRLVMGSVKGQIVDHINQNGLDNRRENLRHCTHRENAYNHKLSNNSTSGMCGVHWNKDLGKWEASISSMGLAKRKQRRIGFYNDKYEAARAWNKEAKKLYGDFAFQNEIPGEGQENL